MVAYATIGKCREREGHFDLSRYPYEAGPAVREFVRGFLEHKEWPLCRSLEKLTSMHTVCKRKAKYVSAAGYRAALQESTTELREKALDGGTKSALVFLFNACARISVRCISRGLSLATEFYQLASEDPRHANLAFPVLERCGDVAASDVLAEQLLHLPSHVTTELLRPFNALNSSNAKKLAKGRGAPADGQYSA